MGDVKLKLLKEEAFKYDITLTAGIGLPKEYDVSSPNENIRQNGIEFMKVLLDKLHLTGIGSVGGTIYSYWPADYSQKHSSSF